MAITKERLIAEHEAAIAQLHGALTVALADRDAANEKLKHNMDAFFAETTRLGDVIKVADKSLKDERESHNLTRDVLHTTELEFAKTRGYLDAIQDSKPPVMVPQQREGQLPSYSDASRSVSPGWQTNGYGQSSNKPWWLR